MLGPSCILRRRFIGVKAQAALSAAIWLSAAEPLKEIAPVRVLRRPSFRVSAGWTIHTDLFTLIPVDVITRVPEILVTPRGR
jgi:hypothetical protein